MKLSVALVLGPVRKILLGLWTESCLIVSAPTPEASVCCQTGKFDGDGLRHASCNYYYFSAEIRHVLQWVEVIG